MTPQAQAKEVVIKNRVFDLEKFQKVTLEGKFSFQQVTDISELPARVGNDKDKLLKVVNTGLLRMQRSEEKKKLVSENAGSAKIVNQFVNTFRLMPPFSTETDRKVQTQKIFEFIKSNQVIFDGVKAAAIAALATEDEDEDEDGETEE